MRLAFWRRASRDEVGQPPAPLPSSTGLPSVSVPSADARGPAFPDDEPEPAVPYGSRPSPSSAVPDLPSGPLPRPAARAELSQLPAVGSAVVGLVRDVLAGGGAAAVTTAAGRPAGDGPADDSRSAAAPPDDTAVADVAFAVMSARLPLLSGVTGSVHDDPDALRLQLAYADVLAGRAERLRRSSAPQLTAAALRQAAREAAGAPTAADAVPAALDPASRLAAAAVLLAQTCLDGGGPVDALPAEVAALAGS